MSTSLVTLTRLRAVQRRMRALIEPLDDDGYRLQFHPDLSPLGWHLGHCTFIENHWLRTVVLGDDRLTSPLHDYYTPERNPKPRRGPQLPDKARLLEEVSRQQDDNVLLLSGMAEALPAHPLLEDEYLERFLIQHHCQHYETMLMVLNQRMLAGPAGAFRPETHLFSDPAPVAHTHVPGGDFSVGGEPPQALDNELPAHRVQLSAFELSTRPVTNAQYLHFMERGGYRDPALWDAPGSAWLAEHPVRAPDHWRQDKEGAWYGIDENGPHDLDPGAPVHGLSRHEARAYACFAGARLPHEHEWEAACRLGLMQDSGHVWEWCENAFYPYRGFRASPYEAYSLPWFDGQHFTLRGGSRHTRRDVRRCSFRNFHTPDKKYVFAGIRLAW
ncbi:SUMF1/EgtB/PvdO family nonheme iron enzyme [Thioalkalivibrio thiocyanodenitrificans]|uniref:SUMF1/EgtB/PvdO family nonheme iron enzyme n=1 Tax=Thioalkalivibrio thiocyanodenitrificans TaxID=243063 RepID=UPI00037716E9|nr:SUMF1/EgtB/PvdO family nonheme iron enzyme [Thioalkalivibrio thiocyanodenitrificans]